MLPAQQDWNKCHSMDKCHSISYCGRFSPGSGCVSALLNTTISYQQVCGWVAGYQEGAPDVAINNAANINQVYFDGLSIHVGNPRNHIWTYMAGFLRVFMRSSIVHVTQGTHYRFLPTLAMTTTASLEMMWTQLVHHVEILYTLLMSCGMDSSVLLWRLPAAHTPACHGSSKHSARTTDNIELRACTTNTGCPGTVPVFLIELYVHWK